MENSQDHQKESASIGLEKWTEPGFIERTARLHGGYNMENPRSVLNVMDTASQVHFENLSSEELPEGISGKMIEGALRVETVIQNTSLPRKQLEFARGLKENFHGASAFISELGDNLKKAVPEKGKVVRKAAASLLVAQMALSACSPIVSPKTPEAGFTQTPVPAETFTPTPTESLPTPTETFMFTPTQTETATATPTEARTAAEETSRYFQPEFQLDLEGSVDGLAIPYTIGFHKSIVERTDEPVKTISANREDTPGLYAKFWLAACWKKYVKQHPDEANISFTQYEDLVKNGGGEIEIAAVDENTDDQNNKILIFHPEKGFVRIFADETVSLPEEGNTLFSFYFGMNAKGQLVIVENALWSKILSEQRGYDGYEGWSGSDMVDVVISDRVAEFIEMIIVADNEALINQGTYWKVAGQIELPNRALLLDPLIYDTQVTGKNPLLTIQK